MNDHKIPSAIDVFSGCGGLIEGLKSAGFSVLAGIEKEAAPSESLSLNHPEVHLFSNDVRDLTANDILSSLDLYVGQLDLMTGCSPCQGFSRMRTRNRNISIDDERNGLVLEFVRLVEGILPKLILFENVPGLINDWRFDEMRDRLIKSDYHLTYDILNMKDYGIPQRRRRLILLGSRFSKPSFPNKSDSIRTVRSTIEHLPKPTDSDDPLQKAVSIHSEEVMNRIRKTPKNGGSRSDWGRDEQLNCHKNFIGYKDVYGRMSWDKPSTTITRFSTNPSKGRYLHPEQDREITLREASLLQTFPPEYKFPLEKYGRVAIASMIGEALPPKFARLLGKVLLHHLNANNLNE